MLINVRSCGELADFVDLRVIYATLLKIDATKSDGTQLKR